MDGVLFKKKKVLVVGGGAEMITAVNWLIDQGAAVAIVDPVVLRRARGHIQSISQDGADFERHKRQLIAPSDSADLVISSVASHELIAQAHARGIPVYAAAQIRRLKHLPSPQSAVQVGKVTEVDDSGALGPERAIASLHRWGGPNCILIAGGNGNSDYRQWADAVARHITPTNTIFLAGSATAAMRAALGRSRSRGIRTYDSVAACWRAARRRARLFVSSVILFSPAAASHSEGE